MLEEAPIEALIIQGVTSGEVTRRTEEPARAVDYQIDLDEAASQTTIVSMPTRGALY
jgi:hypothetical protein